MCRFQLGRQTLKQTPKGLLDSKSAGQIGNDRTDDLENIDSYSFYTNNHGSTMNTTL